MVMTAKIQDFDDPNYDPFAAEATYFGDIVDVYGPIGEMRRQGSVQRGALPELLGLPWGAGDHDVEEFTILGYRDVFEVLRDAGRFSNNAFDLSLGQTFGRTITTMDPPEHTRYRRILQEAFLPQNVQRWGATLVEPVVAELMSEFIDRGEADLVQDFTLKYPFSVIYRQLDLPAADGPVFHRLAVSQNMTAAPESREASRKLGDYFTALIAERRANPGDDLASALINASVDGEYLPEDVLISFLRQLINAAGDTTVRGTSVLLTGLLQNPDQMAALRDDRSLMLQATEEALRWESPVLFTVRRAVCDVELSGVKIPANSHLYVSIGSANRDETVFPDGDRFNIFREKKAERVIPFGSGPHVCVGQHLAKLEIDRALNAILDRLPNLRLDESRPGPVIRGIMLRFPQHLFVKFG